MNETARTTRRIGLAAIGAALAAACAPLTMFATVTPKDPAVREARDVAYGPDAADGWTSMRRRRGNGQTTA